MIPALPCITRDALEQLVTDFEAQYERRYGKGSAFRGAGVELVVLRLRARGRIDPPVPVAESLVDADAQAARMGARRIYVDTLGRMDAAPIYDFARLRPGNIVNGPAVIHTPITTVVVHGAQRALVDPWRNLILELA